MNLDNPVIEEPLEEPHVSQLATVFNSLVENGMGVIPTDTQHAYVTPVNSKSGVRRIYDIKGIATDEPLGESLGYMVLLCFTQCAPEQRVQP